MNAYSYAHNSPLTKSDPTGLRPDDTVGNVKGDERWASDRGMYAGYTLKNGKWVWQESPKRGSVAKQRYTAYKAAAAGYKPPPYGMSKVAAAPGKSGKTGPSAAQVKADRERRSREGVWDAVKRGFMMSISGSPLEVRVASASMEGLFADFGMTNTRGLCEYAGFDAGLVGSGSVCYVSVRHPDGPM
ncbi:hypothetical protein [Streptomyces sp. SID8374]|uniref:hypothetical protein n=1 Tax=Streptomyces sp. SID8374 TaxID=2690354 RepID=UPI00192821C4|nr:hypothetical protein [Streptomyces sp. SID8374]